MNPTPALAWISLGELPRAYLEGGPGWLAGETRRIVTATGCKGCVHHLPFSWQGVRSASGVPQFGFCQAAWLRAKSPAHAKLINGYAAAMKPLVDDGIRIIPYLGSLRLSPELQALGLRQLDDRLRLLAENIKPVCEAGIREVAIDGSVDYGRIMPDGATVEWLECLGLTVWRESNPSAFQSDMWHRPIMVSESDWQARRAMDQYKDVKLTGPVIRFVAAPNGDGLSDAQWGAKWARECAPRVRAILAEGHTPAVECLDVAWRVCPQEFKPVAT